MKIYTKSGDKGRTSLIGGERVLKCDSRVEAYGTVDELSAQMAMLRDMLSAAGITEFSSDLIRILRTLMGVEALMALGKGGDGKVNDLSQQETEYLEKRIDEISETLPALEYFTIPGGHVAVSQAHICRTVCRRAERRAYQAATEHDISTDAIKYLNRLSDFMYIAGRRLSVLFNVEETVWKP